VTLEDMGTSNYNDYNYEENEDGTIDHGQLETMLAQLKKEKI